MYSVAQERQIQGAEDFTSQLAAWEGRAAQETGDDHTWSDDSNTLNLETDLDTVPRLFTGPSDLTHRAQSHALILRRTCCRDPCAIWEALSGPEI